MLLKLLKVVDMVINNQRILKNSSLSNIFVNHLVRLKAEFTREELIQVIHFFYQTISKDESYHLNFLKQNQLKLMLLLNKRLNK